MKNAGTPLGVPAFFQTVKELYISPDGGREPVKWEPSGFPFPFNHPPAGGKRAVFALLTS